MNNYVDDFQDECWLDMVAFMHGYKAIEVNTTLESYKTSFHSCPSAN